MSRSLELHPDFLKEYKNLKLDNKQREKVRKDIKELQEETKIGKQMTGSAFPLFELKYRSWGFRIFYVKHNDKIIILSCGRKKDNVIKSLNKAIGRNID